MKPIIILLSFLILLGCAGQPLPVVKEPEYTKLFVDVSRGSQRIYDAQLKVIINNDTNYYSISGDDFDWIGVKKGDTISITAFSNNDNTNFQYGLDSTYIIVTNDSTPDSLFLDIEAKFKNFLCMTSPRFYYDADQTTLSKEDSAVLKELVSSMVHYPKWRLEFGFHMDCITANGNSAKIISKLLEENVKGVLQYYGAPVERYYFKHYYAQQLKNDCDCSQTKRKCSSQEHTLNRRIEWKIVGYK